MTAFLVMQVKYNLPKGRLSWSQMSLWLKNKDQYRERYYMDGPSFENNETIFGKRVAHMFETGEKHPILDRVPRYRTMEYRIELSVDNVPFLGYIDSFKKSTCSIKEYKTGKEPWNNVRVHKHDQLVVYSLLTKLAHKRVDPYVELIWIETRYNKVNDVVGSRVLEGTGNELEFTGKIEIFRRRIAEWERKRVRKLIVKCAKEISKDYSAWRKEQNNFFK